MIRKLLFVLLTVTALAGGVYAQRWLSTAKPAAISEAKAAALLDIAFADLDGASHRVSEWRGKVLIVNFWASWCPPCLEEMPQFVKLQEELGGSGLQFIGVLDNDNVEAARQLLASAPVNYPVLDGAERADPWSDKLGNKAAALPFSAVFDRAGRLVHAETGPFTREEVLKVVTPLLDANPDGH